MKKLITTALILISIPVFSQNYTDSLSKPIPFEIGISVNQLLAKNDNIENRTGFGISLKRIWRADKKINIISGIVFNQIHYLEKTIITDNSTYYKNMDFRLYDFVLPFIIRANFGNKYKLYVEAGPSVDFMPFLIGKGTEIYTTYTGNIRSSEISGEFGAQNLNLSLNAGIGFKFPVKKLNFFVASNYHLFIFDNILKDIKYTNALLSFSLGMYFN